VLIGWLVAGEGPERFGGRGAS